MGTDVAVNDSALEARAAAIREAAIREAPKHRPLLRSERDGRVLSAVMLPFLSFWAPPGYAVLATTGRKSGRRRRKCIRAIRKGDMVYIVQLRPPAVAVERPLATSAWVHNLRANPRSSFTSGSVTMGHGARARRSRGAPASAGGDLRDGSRGRLRRVPAAPARPADAREDQGSARILVRHGHPAPRRARRLKAGVGRRATRARARQAGVHVLTS